MRPIEPTHTPPTEAEMAEVATLQAEADALEAEWSGADEIPDQIDARVTALDERIAELSSGSWNYEPAEMAMAGVPTVMLFVQSLKGISHNKIEDTRLEHIDLAVRALDRLAEKTMRWVASGERSH
jgi:acetylornithine deacetylase/succinyl-diaminopimelate desuccinylase-like protein